MYIQISKSWEIHRAYLIKVRNKLELSTKLVTNKTVHKKSPQNNTTAACKFLFLYTTVLVFITSSRLGLKNNRITNYPIISISLFVISQLSQKS